MPGTHQRAPGEQAEGQAERDGRCEQGRQGALEERRVSANHGTLHFFLELDHLGDPRGLFGSRRGRARE